MGIEQKEAKIGGATYVVSQFGAKKGRQVLFRLTKALGPAMAGLMMGGFTGAGLGGALQAFAEGTKEEDFDYLCDAFASVTKVRSPVSSGAEIALDLEKVFDDHFRGHYGYMLTWLGFAISVNYSSFLHEMASGGGNLGEMLSALGLKVVQESKSPPA